MRLPRSEAAILALLVAQSPRYGLELVHSSNGQLTRGGIYVTLGRMEKKGLVTSEAADGGRRLYTITGLGARAHVAARIFSGTALIEAES